MKLNRLLSIFLCIAVIVGTFCVSTFVVSAEQLTSVDLDSETPYKFSHHTGTDYNKTETIGGNKYWKTTYTSYNGIPYFPDKTGPYGNGRVAAGIATGWGENVRPTKVSFIYNFGYLSTLTTNQELGAIDVLWRSDATNYNLYRLAFRLTVNKEDRTKDTLTISTPLGGLYGAAFALDGTITSEPLSISPLNTVDESATLADNTRDVKVEVVYDWSEFTEAAGYKVGLTITLTDLTNESNTAVTTLKIKYRTPTTTVEPSATPIVAEDKGYSIGLATGDVSTAKMKTGARDIEIIYQAVPDFAPSVLGATMSTVADRIRFNSEIGKIKSGAKTIEFGTIFTYTQFVTGNNPTLSMDDMTLESMNDTDKSQYLYITKKSVDAANVSAGDTFYAQTFTIASDNYGARVIARSYVRYVYEDGSSTVYYSNNSTDGGSVSTANGVENGYCSRSIINVSKSIMKFLYENKNNAGAPVSVSGENGIVKYISSISEDGTVTWDSSATQDKGQPILDYLVSNSADITAFIDSINSNE